MNLELHRSNRLGPRILAADGGPFVGDTMDTLFWAGNDFAPDLKVDGIPVQEWLQSHYLNAMRQVALRMRDLNNVAGYDTYNEPGTGLAGVNDLHSPEIMMMVMGHYSAWQPSPELLGLDASCFRVYA